MRACLRVVFPAALAAAAWASAARADVIFDNGLANTVSSPINDQVPELR